MTTDRHTRAERFRRAAPRAESASAPYSVLLCVFTFLLILALSARQLTAEATARQLIENGLASLTDIDAVIVESKDALRKGAAERPGELRTVPGFPVAAFLSAEEIKTASDVELRALILARASGIVYESGASEVGGGSVSFLSKEGVLRWWVDQLSAANHARASFAAVVLVTLSTLAAIGVILKNEGFVRLRTLGIVVLVAALAGDLLVTGLGTVAINAAWGGDAFSDDINATLRDGLSIFQRNYFVATCLGLFLAALGIAAGFAAGNADDAELQPDREAA